MLIAVSIGVASGRYLFAEPLREHFEREREGKARQEEEKSGGGGGGDGNG